MFSVSVACPLLVWYVLSGGAISQVGLSGLNWALVSVAWPLCVWHVRNWCGMASVDVAWPQEIWHVLSGCGMAPGCDMASMGVAWLSGCGMASVALA